MDRTSPSSPRSVWSHPYVVLSALTVGALVLYLVFVRQPAEWQEVSVAWRTRLSDSADNRVSAIAHWREGELRAAGLAGRLLLSYESGAAVGNLDLEGLLRTWGWSALFVLDDRLQARVVLPPRFVFLPSFRSLAREVAASGRASAELYAADDALVLLVCARQSGADPERFEITCLRDDVTDQVPALLGRFPATATAEALLARADDGGILFVSPRRFGDASIGTRIDAPNPRLAMAGALAGTPAVDQYVDYRGLPVLAAVRHIPDTSWGVVVKVDLAEVLADYRRERRDNWSAALGASTALLAVAIAVARSRREAADRLRLKVLARLGAVMDGANDAILLVGSDGLIIEANRRAELMYGRPPGGLRATPVGMLHGDEPQPEIGTGATAGPGGAPLFERTHYTAEGRPLTVEISARWLADEHASLYVIRDITSRKRAEAALRETAAELSAIIDAAPVSIVSLSPDGTVRSWNPAAELMFGWTASEALGRPLPFVPPERRDESEGIFARVRQGERIDGIELSRVRKDGSPIDVSLRTARLQLPDGRFAGTMAVMVNITERKRLQAQLERRIRFHRTLSEVNQLIVRGTDRTGLLNGVCRVLTEVGGFPLAWIGWKGADGRVDIVAQAGTASASGDDAAVGTDARVAGGHPGAAADGLSNAGAFPILVAGVPAGALTVYFHEEGILLGEDRQLVAELAENIGFAIHSIEAADARRSAEAQLAASEALYRSLFSNMRNGFAYCRMIDVPGMPLDFEYLSVNPAFEEQTGLKGVVGRRVSEVVPGIQEADPQLFEIYGRVARTGKSESFEMWVSALEMWFAITVYCPSRGYFVAVFDVITERKRAEARIRSHNVELERRVAERTAELEAANRELEAFSYSVSHDLRAPLRAIEGFSRMVVEDYGAALDAEAERLLNVVRANVRKMDRLIDDLLELSRVGRREVRAATIDMHALVGSAWQEVVAEVPVELRMGTLPAASGDSALLRQVWVNLLANAVKFSAPRPEPVVEVGARLDEDEVVYFVRDNGVGFDARYADRLFQVFQRLHSDAEFPGTGVGLAIVARIVGRHGGRAWAEGRPGEGATFFFALPRR